MFTHRADAPKKSGRVRMLANARTPLDGGRINTLCVYHVWCYSHRAFSPSSRAYL